MGDPAERAEAQHDAHEDLGAWFDRLPEEEQREFDELAEMSRPFKGDTEAELLAYREGRHPLQAQKRVA